MRGPLAGLGYLLIFAACFGCNKNPGTASTEPELPDWISDSNAPAEAPPEAIFAERTEANLSLNLNVGDRFALRKVVDQELTQKTLSGVPEVSHSRLELMFAVSVTELQNDRKKLRVQYDRVKYAHDVADEHVAYDSASPPEQIPLGLRAYQAMIQDGFSFWIGADNQIVEVDGLDAFLDRCLQDIPPQDRKDVVLGMEAGAGETGLANFVDNAIGLLPVSKHSSVGDVWRRQQHVARPVPMVISNQFTLQDVGSQTATVDIRGSIAPSTAVQTVASENVSVRVTGGETLGSCTIFLETGLPKESRVDRTIDMVVQMENAVEFQQRKRTTTTISAYPVESTVILGGSGTSSPASMQ